MFMYIVRFNIYNIYIQFLHSNKMFLNCMMYIFFSSYLYLTFSFQTTALNATKIFSEEEDTCILMTLFFFHRKTHKAIHLKFCHKQTTAKGISL